MWVGFPANGFLQHIDDEVGGCENHEEPGAAEDEDEEEKDIEVQIKREVEGLKPGGEKQPRFRAVRLDVPCGAFKHSSFIFDTSVINYADSGIHTAP